MHANGNGKGKAFSFHHWIFASFNFHPCFFLRVHDLLKWDQPAILRFTILLRNVSLLPPFLLFIYFFKILVVVSHLNTIACGFGCDNLTRSMIAC